MREGVVAVEEPTRDIEPPGERLPATPVDTGDSRSEERRCSPDPMQPTDRYRLVTPYVNSSRDL